MSEGLVVLAILLAAGSGVPGLFFGRTAAAGQWLATLLVTFGAVLGMVGALISLFGQLGPPFTRPWHVPGGEFTVGLDGLSVIFLLPIFLVSTLGSFYGMSYWRQADHPENGRWLRLFYGLLTAGMALVVVARNAVLFLAAWEIMALAGFFLVTTEDEEPPVRDAGWIYLVATHVGTLCLFALFALLRGVNGSFALGSAIAETTSPGLAASIFLLAVIGFGLKAGVMPLHVWLPGAHAVAPSHVSAILSGVLIKMGIYGIVRVTGFFPQPPAWWGAFLLGLGAASGVLGIAFAIGQQDVKRLLAYCSIENVGIILMGVGLAVLGKSLGRADWVALGLAAALLHVWNHALFKSLLFFSAGSVIHAVHTRQIDLLGGLAKRMPRTALGFLIGSVAICGLPPLNGFVSEWFLYLGLFGTLGFGVREGGTSWAAASFAAPALSLIGALSLACFVKVFGIVFLGAPRSEHARGAHESGPLMLGPMAILAACCFLIGLAPMLVAPLLDRGISSWAPEQAGALPALTGLAPLGWLSVMACLLAALLGAGAAWLRWLIRRGGAVPALTWDCGYAAPSSRMQYTSSSFAQMLVGLFGWVLRPRARTPGTLGLFPQEEAFHSEVPDTALEEVILPALRACARVFARFRLLQQGGVQTYLLYIFAGLLVLLLWR